MKVIRKIKEMQAVTTKLKTEKKTIGFVATMGFLHEGHTTLMENAKRENDVLISSIFVNPLQFGPTEDFSEYPRDEERDISIARDAGVDFLFIPDVEEMYPEENKIKMHITDRVDVLCGSSRPGHFDGVITVLTKLFHIIQPDRTYFGLKDAQQVSVVDALITNLNFPTELIGIPTVRETDGLAKSSRNVRLTAIERKEAKYLYQALLRAQQLFIDGEDNPAIIIREVKSTIEKHTTGRIDYVELLSFPSLKAFERINEQFIIAVAVQYSNARLIDNLIIDSNGRIVQQYK
ncbi:pantoate--beta-alanine ligase [Oceanobacillus sp. CAU 1775]